MSLSSGSRRTHGSDPSAPLHPGQRFGRFRIVERIGGGGMGDVYKANDGNRLVALKLLKGDVEAEPRNVLRFERELQLARRVTHPNVCKLLEMGDEGGRRYLVMEYVDGQNLTDVLHTVEGLSRPSFASEAKPSEQEAPEREATSTLHLERGLSPWQALRITRQICEGLGAIHATSVVHRDLKPSNVMMTRGGQIVLLDFGLAYHPEADPLTATNEVLGTLRYMAPEQTRGVASDPRSDIYAVGLILFEMLTGKPAPGDGGRLPLALREKEAPCPPPSRFSAELPDELDALVLRCLARDPEERYPNVTELLRDVDGAAEALAHRSLVTLLPGTVAEPKRRLRWLGAALAGAAALALAALALWPGSPVDGPRFAPPYYLSIAPFESLSSQEDAYLAKGFTDAVKARLMTLEGLTVVAESDETGAPLQLEGTVQKENERLRVSYRLLGMPERENLGSDVLDNDAEDIFALQDRVAASVGGRLGALLHEDFVVQLPRPPTDNLEAYGLYLRANALLSLREVDEIDRALGLLDDALRNDPSFTLGLVGRCHALWQKYELTKRPDTTREAERVCQAALARDDRLVDVHTALGQIYRGTGRLDQAVGSFERAIAIDPKNSDAVRGLAQTFVARGDIEAAERTYREAIELRPDHWLGYGWLGALYWQDGRYLEAEREFKKAIEITPTNARGYANLGSVYAAMARYDEAIEMFRLALSIKPTYYVHANLGSTYYYQGRFADAVAELEKAIALNPDDFRAWQNLADAHWWVPARDEAIAAFRRAIDLASRQLEVNPNDAMTWSYLSSYEAKAGEEAHAREHIERALALAPDDVQVLFNAALVYELIGERQRAVDALGRASEAGLAAMLVEEDPFFESLRRDTRFYETFPPPSGAPANP